MSIENTLARLIANADAITLGGAAEARVIALLDALSAEFPNMPTGHMMVALADMLGRLSRDMGGMKTATTLCAVLLLRAQEKRG